MTPAGTALARQLALLLQQLAEHERVSPAEVELLVVALVAHVRSWRPMTLTALAEVAT
jgi:hypothetical protein